MFIYLIYLKTFIYKGAKLHSSKVMALVAVVQASVY